MASQVNASHILIKSEDIAKEIFSEINGGANFEKIAMEKSKCPSGRKGGMLGWFRRGQMVREFENACFSAKKGDLIGPVKTQFGFHIIKINDMK